MGISIGIEGSEGAGKTLLHSLARDLLSKTTDLPLLAIREPGGTPLGDVVRQILRDDKFSNMDSMTNALLYTASRSESFHKLEQPFLKKKSYRCFIER